MELGKEKGFGVFTRTGDVAPLCWRVPVLDSERSTDEYGNLSWGGLHRFSAPRLDVPGQAEGGFWMDKSRSRVMRATELPVEFFNHQLLTYKTPTGREEPRDPYNPEHLIDFVSSWGFPFSPARDYLAIFLHSENADELFSEKSILAHIAPSLSVSSDLHGLPVDIISDTEASFVLYSLQREVRQIHRAIRDGFRIDSKQMFFIDMASRHPQRIYGGESNEDGGHRVDLNACGNLVNAISNQIIDALADEENPWRECACKGCDIVFKNKQSTARTTDSDSFYCCDRHMERQKQRNKRKAGK